MTDSNPFVWNEIPVTDMTRAKVFYSAVLGVEISVAPFGPGTTMGFFPMDQTKSGSGGALVLNERFKPTKGGVLPYFSSSDIDAQLAKVTKAGGTVLLPKTSIGEHGFIGHFIDSEGNVIGLHAR